MIQIYVRGVHSFDLSSFSPQQWSHLDPRHSFATIQILPCGKGDFVRESLSLHLLHAGLGANLWIFDHHLITAMTHPMAPVCCPVNFIFGSEDGGDNDVLEPCHLFPDSQHQGEGGPSPDFGH